MYGISLAYFIIGEFQKIRLHLNSNVKPYAKQKGVLAVTEHLRRLNIDASVEANPHCAMYHRVRYNVTTEPRVSIIIPTYNGFDLLERCVSSIYRTTTYRNFEIIVVDNLSNEKSALSYMEELARTGKIKLLRYPKEFNYSAINNFAVRHANGDVLVLLNNDTEVISGEWLTELVSHAVRPDVGAVGALLLFTDGLIQHAGVILGLAGVAGHDHLNHPSSTDRHFGHVQMTREVSAVTGACLAVRREVYHEVGGLDEDNLPVAFNDIDFCIRLAERGYRNIYTPFARLYHHEFNQREVSTTRLRSVSGLSERPAICGLGTPLFLLGSLLQPKPFARPCRPLSLIPSPRATPFRTSC